MPAVSKSQQRLFGMAEHNPGALYSSNASLGKLPKQTLHDFAATPTKSLPVRVAKAKPLRAVTPHTGFRSVMSGQMPKEPGIRWGRQ